MEAIFVLCIIELIANYFITLKYAVGIHAHEIIKCLLLLPAKAQRVYPAIMLINSYCILYIIAFIAALIFRRRFIVMMDDKYPFFLLAAGLIQWIAEDAVMIRVFNLGKMNG